MWQNIINVVIVAMMTVGLLWFDVPLETALLVGYITGCFLALSDISRTLHKMHKHQ